ASAVKSGTGQRTARWPGRRVIPARARGSAVDLAGGHRPGKTPQAQQPRQGPLSQGGLHQGAGDRLLPAHRASAPAPPARPAGDVQCCEVALLLKGMFDHLGLQSFAKTSGSKGLQIYLPLNFRTTYGETKPFALAVARTLAAQRPDLIVSNMKKSLRPGKVL